MPVIMTVVSGQTTIGLHIWYEPGFNLDECHCKVDDDDSDDDDDGDDDDDEQGDQPVSAA